MMFPPDILFSGLGNLLLVDAPNVLVEFACMGYFYVTGIDQNNGLRLVKEAGCSPCTGITESDEGNVC